MLALFLPQIKLSDTAGMVARGEAIGGAEADELEKARQDATAGGHPAATAAPSVPDSVRSGALRDE